MKDIPATQIMMIRDEAELAARADLPEPGTLESRLLIRSIDEVAGTLERDRPGIILVEPPLDQLDGARVSELLISLMTCRYVPFLMVDPETQTTGKIGGIARENCMREPRIHIAEPEDRSDVTLELGNLRLATGTHECRLEERRLRLRPKEYELLKHFMIARRQVLSRDYLARKIWKSPYMRTSRAIDAAVQRLRRKLGSYGNLIETVRGYGFRFNDGGAPVPEGL